MNAATNEIPADSKMSFFDKAAWYTLAAPISAVAIGYAALIAADRISGLPAREVDNIQQVILGCVLVAEFVSLITGLTVCCMIRHHRRKLTIWIAMLGILACFGLGALTLFALAMSSMGSNC